MRKSINPQVCKFALWRGVGSFFVFTNFFILWVVRRHYQSIRVRLHVLVVPSLNTQVCCLFAI